MPESTQKVTVENFVRAETDVMFDRIVSDAGGTNKFAIHRQPADLARQPIIRPSRSILQDGGHRVQGPCRRPAPHKPVCGGR